MNINKLMENYLKFMSDLIFYLKYNKHILLKLIILLIFLKF